MTSPSASGAGVAAARARRRARRRRAAGARSASAAASRCSRCRAATVRRPRGGVVAPAHLDRARAGGVSEPVDLRSASRRPPRCRRRTRASNAGTTGDQLASLQASSAAAQAAGCRATPDLAVHRDASRDLGAPRRRRSSSCTSASTASRSPAGCTCSEVVREVRQDLAAVLGDDHQVLEPAAAVALAVAAGLERDHVAGQQRVGRAAQPGRSCTSSPTPWPSPWK